MTFKRQIPALLIMILAIPAGCKKFVEIDPPRTQLVTASVFNNSATATVAQTGIYTQMFSTSYNISLNNGLLSDEFTNYNPSSTSVQTLEYMNQMVAANTFGLWGNAYSYIYQENSILASLNHDNALSPAVIRQLTGEALFIRAFWHFYLTNCYGDVPLVTSTDYTVNNVITRSPRAVVLQQIVTDLHAAEGLLSTNFVNADDTSSSAQTERVRPTSWAATALLARAYLYQGNWAGADSAASVVIGNSPLFGLVGLDSVFLKNSREAIWQIQTPTPALENTQDGYYYILTSTPNGSTNSGVTLSPQLLGTFESSDNRYRHWVDSAIFSGKPYYFPFKYKMGTQVPATVTEYTMVLRLAEQYLIRAEAEAQLNDLTNSANDLNTIRSRAGLTGTPASSQSDLLRAILHERQIELFSEWGHRWFDLVRTGEVNSVMGSPGNVTQYKQGAWVATDTLYPVPLTEININHNLTQNAGY